MFVNVFKSTTKTLFRSILLWLIFVFVIIIAMEYAIGDNIRITILDDNYKIVGYMTDTDPQYVLDFDQYIQTILNGTKTWVMLYSMPLFCVISASVILYRDFNDGFFEVEKASGGKISKIFLGKLSAILIINFLVCIFCTFLSIYYYYFSRGGLIEFSTNEFIIDSIIRILRVFFASMFPAMVFFISVTYIGTYIMKNSFFGTVLGIGMVLFEYTVRTGILLKNVTIYHDYISPCSKKLYQYWTFYDTEWFNEKITRNPFTFQQMLCSLLVTLVISSICFFVSYICNQRRNV